MNLGYVKEELERKYGLERSYKQDIDKISSYIEKIRNEVELDEEPNNLIEKINKNEKIITNILPDKKEHETELDIVLSKNDLLKSVKYTSKKASILPIISSPSNSVKLSNRIKEELDNSYSSDNIEEELDRISKIDLESITYENTKHVDYASLLEDEKLLRKSNKIILKKIENLNIKYDKQYDIIIESIMKNKENLNFIKKVFKVIFIG